VWTIVTDAASASVVKILLVLRPGQYKTEVIAVIMMAVEMP
jgi:hypothetical protein